MHILLRQPPKPFYRRSFFKSREVPKPQTSEERRAKYIAENKHVRPEPSVSTVQENTERTEIIQMENSSLPLVRQIDKGANALSTYLLDWKQNERNTAVLPQYKILFTMMFTFWISYRLTLKESRTPGGYLYESTMGEIFGSRNQRELREATKIRRIVYQISLIKKDEERRKKEDDSANRAVTETKCYAFPIYSDVPQVKIPIFKAKY